MSLKNIKRSLKIIYVWILLLKFELGKLIKFANKSKVTSTDILCKTSNLSRWIERNLGEISQSKKYSNKFSKFTLKMGHISMGNGSLERAIDYYHLSEVLSGSNNNRYLKVQASLGAAKFMVGDVDVANKHIKNYAFTKRIVRENSAETAWLRVLGQTWYAAIGHICLIDFYLKQYEMKLSYYSKPEKIILNNSGKYKFPNIYLIEKVRELGVEVIGATIGEYYDTFKPVVNKKRFNDLSDLEISSMADEMWDYDFGEEQCYIYTHGISIIQKEWERRNNAPLFRLNSKEKSELSVLLNKMGIPQDSWYVCLHVRESGFHEKWNKMYPSSRDADISTYIKVIEEIANRGGYVVRLGDESMQTLPEMENLIDYSHSNYKSEKADILLSAGCRFYIGTNSGLATVPGIFGVPMVLTNWLPISLPLWFGQDLMIPKLFLYKPEARLMSLEEMLNSKAGAIQNTLEFSDEIVVQDNTPDDLRDAVIEMIEKLEGTFSYADEDAKLQDKYSEICNKNGSYKGSNIGYYFSNKYNILPV